MKKSLNYDFLKSAKKMPPLYHSVPAKDPEDFDIMESEAAEWLCNIPEVRQKIFDMANRKGLIIYDPDTRKWKGAKT